MHPSQERQHPAAGHVDELIAHADRLGCAVCAALAEGRYREAEALLEQAELLASDVTAWVDDLERHQAELEHAALTGAADASAPMSEAKSTPLRRLARVVRSLGIGIGASIAAGAMLIEG